MSSAFMTPMIQICVYWFPGSWSSQTRWSWITD